MLTALGSIATQQAKPTEATKKACHKLLDYAATHPNATVRYHKSDMILCIDSDASYLSESKAKSRAAGYFYCSDNSMPPKQPQHNGPILVICPIMKMVVTSFVPSYHFGVNKHTGTTS